MENKGDSKDKIWLTDFGLARRFDDVRMSMTGAMLGTPNYMSPEQAAPARHPIDHRTDIYSLGATLFELLTGRTVFPADTPHAVLAQVLAEEAPLLTDVIPGAHRDLETIVMKCLEKEPRDRYQSAGELADDFEAFVAGNPIRGRRPGVVERFSRWRKQNDKTVRWAGATAAAMLTLLAVALASWLGWRNATTGQVLIQSNDGPIVGQLIDAEGNRTPTFTIPMQQEMPVKAGSYQLQTWAKNRIGQTQGLFVRARTTEKLKMKLPDFSAFPDRTIDGVPKLWRRGGKADGKPEDISDGIVLWQYGGVARLDPDTGKEIWSTDEKELVALSKLELAARKKRGRGTWEERLLGPFEWWKINKLCGDDDWRIPGIAANFPDINDDQEPDLLIAARTHPTVIALDGKTGKRLWRYTSVPPHDDSAIQSRTLEAFSMNEPTTVSDIDGDGMDDVIVQFYAEKEWWMDAVSSKTGKQLWRNELPEDWFDPAKTSNQTGKTPLLSFACQIGFWEQPLRSFGNDGFFRDWNYQGRTHCTGMNLVVAPWQNALLPLEKSESGLQVASGSPGKKTDSATAENLLLTFCGSRLAGYDPATGKPSLAFNEGEPLDLGYFPALQPQLVNDDDGRPLGLLLCEMVTRPDTQNGTKPLTRFHLLSMKTATTLWTFTTDCDPSWTGLVPDWPLIEDLNGDGTPEIIVAAGGELGTSFYRRPSLDCTLQAIDAVTGKTIWDQNRLPKLRCKTRQIQNVLIGPDADGDQLDDIYAICPMSRDRSDRNGKSSHIFIDVLSGVSGQKIRVVECLCPSVSGAIDPQKPFFWGVAPDGGPQLVLSSYRTDSSPSGTFFVSTNTGAVNHFADGLSLRLQMPSEKKGDKTLFLTAPRSARAWHRTSDLVTVKPQPATRINQLGDHQLTPAADFDSDGLPDLINGTNKAVPKVRAIASRDAQVLWEHDFNNYHFGFAESLDADLNGDETKDVLVWTTTELTCLSGRTGKQIWSTVVGSVGSFGSRHITSRFVEAKGSYDIYVTYSYRTIGRNGQVYLKLLRLDGTTGARLSEVALIEPAAVARPFRLKPDPSKWPVLFTDFDADGRTEIVSLAVNSANKCFLASWDANGKLRWRVPLNNALKNHERARVNLIAGAGEDGAGLIAVAKPSKNRSRVRWFDIKEGKLIADWVCPEELLWIEHYQPITSGLPIAIRDGDRVLTGICTEDNNNRGRNLHVHVLDVKDNNTQEVRLVNVCGSEFSGGIEKNTKLLIVDVDGNGQDEVVSADSKKITATTLATGKEILRNEFSLKKTKLIGLTEDSSQIEIVGQRDERWQLHLLDIKTLRPNWIVDLPSLGSVSSLVSRAAKSPPLVSFYNSRVRQNMLVVPQASDYQGDGEAGFESAAIANADKATMGLSPTGDARWIQRLPWSVDGSVVRIRSFRFARQTIQALAVCLGAIVFPIWFVGRLIKRRRWSLMVTMLMPLLFVVPYMVLNLNLAFDQTANDWTMNLGIPFFAARMLVSLWVLPVIAFCWFCVRCLRQGNWLGLAGILSALVFACCLMAAFSLLVSYPHLSDGSRYLWWDWGHLSLVGYSMVLIGIFLIVIHIYLTGPRLVSVFRKRGKVSQAAS